MKVIKLCYDDPDLFQTTVTSARCDFMLNHFEAFMQMYKTQGSTFWLRFIVSFKNHVEEKFCNSKKWLTFLMNHFQFIKVLNFIYISLHKRLIESSNTAVKKLINNLITLSLNSPSYLNFSCEQWLIYIKSCKQVHNIFQNLFGVQEPFEYTGFTAFIYCVYTDFFCALCAVFEQWYKTNDLTEEELKKIDSKIIYWLPSYDTDRKIKPSCFEKYISDYWKENLQRMLLTDNIHNLFSEHKTAGCCEKFDKEKNIFRIFQFTDKHTIELMKLLCNDGEIDDSEESVHTITEVSMKDICMLKPQTTLCTSHKKCFVKIVHGESCLEPFMCSGGDSCIETCETNLKNTQKQEKRNGKKQEKFWKNVTVEVFPVDKKKNDVSTTAESYNRDIITYVHAVEAVDLDMPFSMLKHTYHQCLADLHSFDLNPRRTECLNRLRKKLSQKNPSSSFQFNVSALRQSFYRESLFENALGKYAKLQEHYCTSRGHDLSKCLGQCFKLAENTVATSTLNAFGRVVYLSRTYITIPYELTCEGKLNHTDSMRCEKHTLKRSESKKSSKRKTSAADGNSASSSNSSKEVLPMSPASAKKEKNDPENDAQDDTDEDIDEILKLIGIGEADDNLAIENNSEQTGESLNHDDLAEIPKQEEAVKKELVGENCNDSSAKHLPNQEEATKKFLNLINLDEATLGEERFGATKGENSNNTKLKVCAYCKKKETRRKMFKKCSRCKEENFPSQHYYCSRECLLTDWAESHEAEHLKFSNQLA